MDELDLLRHERPGYRLDYLEVYNWGAFDSSHGQVYRLEPQGRTALLIGQNGSGKSTLVDAMLTLLVQPGVRNYNVAAGAKKRERDERTYIKGACGRSSSEDDNGSVTDYLRPKAHHFSALLACFRREDTGETFTLAQVLYLAGDGDVEKIYAFANDARTIAGDLSHLDRAERIRSQIQDRGFRATTKYSEYHGWLTSATNIRPKAMDMFNQTVAVKDIQSLNRFIRDHMLEARPWHDKIDSLLTHFTQLSQAHQALVRARRQVELLEPIEKLSKKERKLDEALEQNQKMLDATDSFFRSKTVELVTPMLVEHEKTIEQTRQTKLDLQIEIDDLDDTQRYYKNEIEKAGGERLRQIPQLIVTQQTHAGAKQSASQNYHGHLSTAGLVVQVNEAAVFVRLRRELKELADQTVVRLTDNETQRIGTNVQLAQVRDTLREDRDELESLRQRQGNLPQWLVAVRVRLMESLGMAPRDLPFASELIAVAAEHRDWEASIEMVLRRFALSLLVPQKHYRLISSYVERTHLVDDRGRGQRLVYLRVGEQTQGPQHGDRLHDHSLLRRLEFRDGHPLLPWVKSEIEQRHNYQCCDTLDEFHSATRLAMTRQRHIKVGDQRHEKDDRPQSIDPRNYVLGWDNREKRARLAEAIAENESLEGKLDSQLQQLQAAGQQLQRQRFAAEQAYQVDAFDSIDFGKHLAEIEALEDERRALEDSNEAVKLLRARLKETQELRAEVYLQRDRVVATESQLEREIKAGRDLLKNAEGVLRLRRRDGSLSAHQTIFEALTAQLVDTALTIETLPKLENDLMRQFQSEVRRLTTQCEPLRNELIRCMQKFLNDFPEEKNDLLADLPYIESFLGLLEQLRDEDLPRHENRFKERLNEKVLQEIGIFHASLQGEKQEICSKIDTLNKSLAQLEYRSGTLMRLDPRAVNDREIRDFQASLRECLADSFDGTPEADEARFNRIDKLIQRLREEERWRDKVTDVRRWFDFAAREIDADTGQERYCYEDSSGQSGGEKAKLAFTILVAAIAYQYDLDPQNQCHDRFHFAIVDEMFSKVDDRHAEYALQLFEKFGLQLLIVAPLDAKARVTEPFVGCYLHTVCDEQTRMSQVYSMTAREYEEVMVGANASKSSDSPRRLRFDGPHPTPAPRRPK